MPGALNTNRVDLSVIIPVYNNAATLDELIDRLLATLGSLPLAFEIILVDDGSRDDSLAILRRRSAHDPRIRTFALTKNFGSQAAACAALDQVRGRWVMSMDADLENCPEDIPAFLEPLEQGYDLVCGYRESRSAPLLTRRLPSWLMNLYVRRKTNTQIRDLGCGMKGCQAWLVHNLEAEGDARRLLPPLLLQRARTVAEVPVRQGARHQSGGHSFLTLFAMAADYYLLSARRPFLVAGLVSALGLAASAILSLAGALFAALLLATASFVGLLLSLVGEYCQRIYQLTQGMPFYKLRDLGREDRESEPADLPDDVPRRATPT
jgi:glycosyltransferase involved in cell wall biosynthesis